MIRARLAVLLIASACGARTELGGINRDPLGDAAGLVDAMDSGDANADAGPPPSPCVATAPVKLASGGKEIQFIALDDMNVYWTDFALGTVNVVPKAGGAVRVLAGGRASPSGVVVNGGNVFWTEFSGDVVASTPASGAGSAVTIADNQDGAYEITAVGDLVYWTTLRGCTVARQKGKGYEVLAKAKQPFTSIVSTSALVFWVSFQQKALERFDVSQSTTSSLLDVGSELPTALATDGANVYFGLTPASQLVIGAVAADGSHIHTLYDAACTTDAGIAGSCLAGIATDGASVYFTTATGDGLVRKVPVGGGDAVTVADSQARPLSVAVDGSCVYWGNLADGTIWAAPK